MKTTFRVALLAAASFAFSSGCDEPPAGEGEGEGELAECDVIRPCPDDLECVDSTCVAVSPECVAGAEGCPCAEGDTCGDDLVCSPDLVCEELVCPAGDEGCGCLPGDQCGVAADGALLLCDRATLTCVAIVEELDDPTGGAPSAECYSPCSQSLNAPDGTFRYCSPEGLMEGCLGFLECVDGSCVAEGEIPAGCSDDVDCPEHQSCTLGYCLSDCALDSDCADGAVCASMTCRVACTSDGSAPCPAGSVCNTLDGDSGWCLPEVVTDLEPAESGLLPMELSARAMAFNNNRVSNQIYLTNHGTQRATVTVTKAEHTKYTPAGRVRVETNALSWLHLTVIDGTTAVIVDDSIERQVTFDVLPGETIVVRASEALNSVLTRWEGRLHVSSARLGEDDIFLDYSTQPDGQWQGTSYYFVDFPTGNEDKDAKVDDWLAAMQGTQRSAKIAAAAETDNALLMVWTEFRTNPLFTLTQWDAAMQSVVDGQWKLPVVHDACRQLNGVNGFTECYLYADPYDPEDYGLREFKDQAEDQVPSGVLQLPFTVRLATDAAGVDPMTMRGRMETSAALHFPGRPPATLRFASDPASCEGAASETCVVSLAEFSVTSAVGGRYLVQDDEACPYGFEEHRVPWLANDFTEGTVLEGNLRARKECREARFPIDVATDPQLGVERNLSLSGANPLPDGRVRRRDVTLLDGIMVNQTSMVMLVRETFTANLESPSGESDSAADFQAYSLIRLDKGGTDLSRELEPYTPGLVIDDFGSELPEPEGKLANTCSPDLVYDLLGTADADGREPELALQILTGSPSDPVAGLVTGEVHYLCHVTGRFDGGAPGWTNPEGCPRGSGATYFLYSGSQPIAEHACQGSESDRCDCVPDENGACVDVDCSGGAPGTCADVLKDASYSNDFQVGLPYQCREWADEDAGLYGPGADPLRVGCDDEPFELTAGKLFYEVGGDVTSPLRTLIADAFRYKTRFKSRSGQSVGFVPSVCESDPTILPYCYDPGAIEDVRERMSCLVDLFAGGDLGLPGALAYDLTVEFLEGGFSFYQPIPFGPVEDGFERLYSELLIMLGDEELTGAVASRFDLAGSAVSSFPGNLLEPGGITLSGGAGNEMVRLYRAQQYYQLVLDRFFRLSPSLWQGLEPNQQTRNFVTIDSLATYFNRVILASTKKAQASSEIAKRYQAFNRPELARHVVERAFVEAYLESVAIVQFMDKSEAVLAGEDAAAKAFELEQAGRRYRQALELMRGVYRDITDELTFFGDPPEYIPFPVPWDDVSAPRQMLDRAKEALDIAKEREDRALTSNREFDVDAAQFQSELASIRQQYEDQLAELCGTFTGPDGTVYPAIQRYADQNSVAVALVNPCGWMGNGAIWEAMFDVQTTSLDLRAEIADIRAVHERVRIEQNRVTEECAGRVQIADLGFSAAGERVTARAVIQAQEASMAEWERDLAELDRQTANAQAWGVVAAGAVQAAQACAGDITGTFCTAGAAGAAGAITANTLAATNQMRAIFEQSAANRNAARATDAIHEQELLIEGLQRDESYATQLAECCLDEVVTPGQAPTGSCLSPGPILVNSKAQVDDMVLDLMRAGLEAQRAELERQRAIGRVAGMNNEARRLLSLQEETEGHLINVEAARNDPNVRIYANADVLAADKAFYLALTSAFRATRMYEYYTATSYAAKEFLFLVRMAGRGENNLEDYLLDLEYAFNDFEQEYGAPSTRVEVVTLMDHIFRIPRMDAQGHALNPAERTAMLRERLTDPALIDDRGYIRIPFSTSILQTSPLTSIHKLKYVEAELQGSDLGDRLGRLYLTPRGTSTIRTLDDALRFHRMEPVTAVINPYFNANKAFDNGDVYQEKRLRGRPFANTLWELTLNLQDEAVNEDINVNGITDVRVYLYYEDFTQL